MMMPEYDKHVAALVAIDICSRHIYAQPLLNKSSEACRRAFDQIFTASKQRPEQLSTDQASIISMLTFFRLTYHQIYSYRGQSLLA